MYVNLSSMLRIPALSSVFSMNNISLYILSIYCVRFSEKDFVYLHTLMEIVLK